MILQIPVRGGFRGGDIYLKNRNQRTMYKTSRNSHRYCHLTVFYNDSQRISKPLDTGSRLELVFDLCHESQFVGRPVTRNINAPLPQATPPQFSEKQKKFQSLFSCWKEEDDSWVNLLAIPLDHAYSGSNLTSVSLKGADRTTVEQIVSLLGDFADVHLATVTKYIGYNEDDWAVSGIHNLKKRNGGKLPIIRERHWTEYWAGDWSELQDCQLKSSSSLQIYLPDQLLGHEETVFQLDPKKINWHSNFEGLEFKRQMIILWPKKKIFNVALAFGVDQALDIIEKDAVEETKEAEMKAMIEYCKEHPCETWFPNNRDRCGDFRCVSARDNPIELGSKRALRIINLCLQWKLKSCGLELISILFDTNFEWDLFCCWGCATCFWIYSPFVGGVCSNDVASALAELIVMVGWNSLSNNISQFHISESFDVKQIDHLSHLAVCLVNYNCLDGAKIVRDEVFEILKMEQYLKKLTELEDADETFGSCIAMLALVDGLSSPEDGVLDNLLVHLKTFSGEQSSTVIGWISKIDATLLKSLSHLDYHPELLANLELQLETSNPPSPSYTKSFTTQEVAAAQLVSSYLKLQDGQMLKSLMDRITGSKILLSSVLTTRSAWTTSSSLADTTLAQLVAAQLKKLSQFEKSLFSSKQLVLSPEHKAVEEFLHSDAECLTYENSFTNEEEARNFVFKFFSRRLAGTSGCVADCEIVKTLVDGEAKEKICVVISKNWNLSNLPSSHKRPNDSSYGHEQKKFKFSDSV